VVLTRDEVEEAWWFGPCCCCSPQGVCSAGGVEGGLCSCSLGGRLVAYCLGITC
jgi:hypothetical protein